MIMKTGISDDSMPRRLRYAFVALVLGAGILCFLILGGVFDPWPLADERMLLKPGPAEIPANNMQVKWVESVLLEPPYTLQLRARYVDGEMDIGYGLAIGDKNDALVVAVSPAGYVSIWTRGSSEGSTHLPWQTWPHIRTGAEINEIRLDNDGRQLTVWVNREYLWTGPAANTTGQVGLFGESFGGPAGVNYPALTLFK